MKCGLILFLIFGIFQQGFAKDMRVHCQAQFNGEAFLDTQISLPESEKNLILAEVEGLQILLSSLRNEKIELQVYDANAPIRVYSTGELKNSSDAVELSLWGRDYLLDVSCSLP